jgi:hypothetical protein
MASEWRVMFIWPLVELDKEPEEFTFLGAATK